MFSFGIFTSTVPYIILVITSLAYFTVCTMNRMRHSDKEFTIKELAQVETQKQQIDHPDGFDLVQDEVHKINLAYNQPELADIFIRKKKTQTEKLLVSFTKTHFSRPPPII